MSVRFTSHAPTSRVGLWILSVAALLRRWVTVAVDRVVLAAPQRRGQSEEITFAHPVKRFSAKAGLPLVPRSVRD